MNDTHKKLIIGTAIILAFAIFAFIALSPVKRLQDARDAIRTADVETILTAVRQASVDHKGNFPSNMPMAGHEAQLGTQSSGCAITTGGCNVKQSTCVNLMVGTTNLSKYLKTIPVDPTSTFTAGKTGYAIKVDTNGIVTVKACAAEGATNISQSR